ncbi:hypothetical protein [Segetibacter koreensis]|uniref:hypothetical protein n=1 Tax=Segetibacter koreensis TaxID=398037 RepID=UPI00035C4E25|nr:hypothetical protein [Segetibacter koreensis]
MKPAIVVVTYNRPASLSRLLTFLSNSTFTCADITLIISIDYQDTLLHKDVVKIAEGFNWEHGCKKIIEHKKNLGLKAHVLSCGDWSELYEAVIVLEDDIVVSPYFYDYALQTLEMYDKDKNIAGISLYAFQWNSIAARSFTPAANGYDVYFSQNAQSWGQVWSKRMWAEFKEWYLAHKNDEFDKNLPDNVRSWSDKSWLKYHIWYCFDQHKYFVYPYVSLSTNHSDLGVHLKGENTNFQVPLLTGRKAHYDLPAFDTASCKYDVFFERNDIASFPGIEDGEICIDLYGKKKNREKRRFWLTCEVENFKVVKSFALELRPHELNIIFSIPGCEIFLYDTEAIANNKLKKNKLEAKRTLYDIKEVPSQQLINVLKFRFLKKIKR